MSSLFTKKEYDRIPIGDKNNEEDGGDVIMEEEDDEETPSQQRGAVSESEGSSWWARIRRGLHLSLVPDDTTVFWLDGIETIRFAKFFLWTALGLIWMHKLVAWMVRRRRTTTFFLQIGCCRQLLNVCVCLFVSLCAHGNLCCLWMVLSVLVKDWERDLDYTLLDMLVYDGNLVVLDTVVFFVMGRLHRKRGVDHLAWMGLSWLSATYTSWSYTFSFLQHSATLYEMHCRWPWQLWTFAILLVVLGAFLVVRHVLHFYHKAQLSLKLVEIAVTLFLFVLPQALNANFHFHHYAAGWLLGIHANADTWWSRATMAWCWGQYINGIAVYGRDPPLTCGYAYYVSIDQTCPYLDCYVHQITTSTNETQTVYNDLPTPDWRNCSSSAYHP